MVALHDPRHVMQQRILSAWRTMEFSTLSNPVPTAESTKPGFFYKYVCFLYFFGSNSVLFYFEVPLVFMAPKQVFQNKVVQKRFHFITTSLNFGA